ncbi:MAG: hypothetical protein K0S28_1843 [Paucimonas sp.]|nr:hypothetical protein [Paucimonas sp.]
MTSVSRQHRKRLSALLLATSMLSNPAWAAKPAWNSLQASRTYTEIQVAADDTVNPMRGYYRWRTQEKVPQSVPAMDAYQRYYWRNLETARGQYNFSSIINDLQAAKSQGRKFAFRVRMMAGYDDNQLYLPDYVVNNTNCQHGCGWWADSDPNAAGLTFVPDWNDPYLIQRARALLTALAQAIGTDPGIAWIDVGMYGQYGEWALRSNLYANAPAGITVVTDANKREYAKMHFDAFPSRQFVMFALYSNRDALSYALSGQSITAKPVGLRVDCLGRAGFFDQWTNHAADWEAFKNQWQKAPFVGEFCSFESGDASTNSATARQQAAAYHISLIGNGNFAPSVSETQSWGTLTPQEQNDLLMLGREAGYRYSVTNSHVDFTSTGKLTFTATVRNNGNAPAYEAWTVQAELVNSQGGISWKASLPLNLGTLLGEGVSQSVQGTWTLPNLPSGTYTLRLVARDPNNVRPMLKWTIGERSGDGGLNVVTLRRR